MQLLRKRDFEWLSNLFYLDGYQIKYGDVRINEEQEKKIFGKVPRTASQRAVITEAAKKWDFPIPYEFADDISK